MFEALRKLAIALNLRAERHETGRDLKRLVVGAAKAIRRGPGHFRRQVEGIQAMADLHAAEVATWVPPETLAEGRGGPFDACDLRHWLALADRAGVAAVPARVILVLEEHEFSKLSGEVEFPDRPATRLVAREAAKLREELGAADPEPDPPVDRDALVERLAAALDDVPEGWMVRSVRTGGGELKAMAGIGAAGPTAPQVRFGPDVEVGPGWIRRGNRRYVNTADRRTVVAQGQGPDGPATFVARPWVEASRWATGEDPNRHGLPFAGKGTWPAEWRAFVERGVVVGVSSYYGWCGSATPENARMALAVRDLAGRIAAEAMRQKAWPRYMDVEFVRTSGHPDLRRPEILDSLERFGRDTVSCTLDFIETADGLLLLEGGPGATPFNGGHPCAFAGCGGPPKFGNRTRTEGVAFRTMPQIVLARLDTWVDGDRTGCILPWAEVERLAAEPAGAEAAG